MSVIVRGRSVFAEVTNHHARAVVVCNLSAPELNDSDGVIDILVLCETWLDSNASVSTDRLGHNLAAEEP